METARAGRSPQESSNLWETSPILRIEFLMVAAETSEECAMIA